MDSSRPQRALSIGEVARATGLSEVNIRAWERRHDFPVPDREASGHRRYPPAEVERVLQVLRERRRGIGLRAAIERVRGEQTRAHSFYASLRERHPELRTVTVKKPYLLALCRAVEDESLARGERGVLIGAFQRERFYRQSERRWGELSRGATAALVFANFAQQGSPRGGPLEIPLDRSDPLTREWAFVCRAPEHVACLIGWEAPAERGRGDAERDFETFFSLDPRVVGEATEIALAAAERSAPDVVSEIRAHLAGLVDPAAESQLRLATDITARLASRLG